MPKRTTRQLVADAIAQAAAVYASTRLLPFAIDKLTQEQITYRDDYSAGT